MRTLLVFAVLVLPSQAFAQIERDPFTHALIGAMMIGHGTDLATTTSCIAIDTCVELNPLLKPMVHKPLAFGSAKMAVAVGVSAFLLKYHEKHKWPARLIAGGMAALLFTVSAKNATLTPPRENP